MVNSCKHWILNLNKLDQRGVVPSSGYGVFPHFGSEPQFARYNLGFILDSSHALHGIFSMQTTEGDLTYRTIRRYQAPLHRQQMTSSGLAGVLTRSLHGSDGHGFGLLKRHEFKAILELLHKGNQPKEKPLQISSMIRNHHMRVLVHSERLSTVLIFDMERDLENLSYAGRYIQSIKQELQSCQNSPQQFKASYQMLQEQARSISVSLFQAQEQWKAFDSDSIVVTNSTHGLFPWELIYYQDQILSLVKNFSRMHYWPIHIYAADRIARKKYSIKLAFLDALHTEKSYQEWLEICNIGRLCGVEAMEYIRVETPEDVLRAANRFSIIHLAGHGEILDNQLLLKLPRATLPLHPRNFYMPLPLLMVAHICAAAGSAVLQDPSFPAHHFLVPDIMVKDGSQRAFFQAFYMNVFQKNSIGQSVRLGRQASLLGNEDPFAFVYYGNGDLSLKSYASV